MTDDLKRRGRPRLDPASQRSAPIHVRLTVVDHAAITKAAAVRRESVADLVRRVVRRELGSTQ